LVAALSLLLLPLVGSKRLAGGDPPLKLPSLSHVEHVPPSDYPELQGLLDAPGWKAGALRTVSIHESPTGPPLDAPAAERSSSGEPQPPRLALSRVTAAVAQTPNDRECKLTSKHGNRELSSQGLRDGSLDLGTLLDSEHDVTLLLACGKAGFFSSPLNAQATITDGEGATTLSPSDVAVRLSRAFVAPDADSGPDANRSTPTLVGAVTAVGGIEPAKGSVQFRRLDTTDYVRVYPSASFTSALLCARIPIAGSVVAQRDDSETNIGTWVFGGRCLAVASDRWDGIVFHVVSTTVDGFEYEIMALSGNRSPALGLVAWFVGQRVASEGALTRREQTAVVRELLDAFDVKLEPDRHKAEIVGDATVIAFVNTLADLEKGSP